MIFPRRAKFVDFAVCPMFSLFAVARFVCEKVANKLRKNGRKKETAGFGKKETFSHCYKSILFTTFLIRKPWPLERDQTQNLL